MDENNNGCNLLDEVGVSGVKGYRGLMTAYMRSILGQERFAEQVSVLEGLINARVTDKECDYAFDRILRTNLDPVERRVVCFYFGLQCYQPHDLLETAAHMNRYAADFGSCLGHMDVSDVGRIINETLPEIGDDAELTILVNAIKDALDEHFATPCAVDKQAPDKQCCCDKCRCDEDAKCDCHPNAECDCDAPCDDDCKKPKVEPGIPVRVVNFNELKDKPEKKAKSKKSNSKKSGSKKTDAKKAGKKAK